MMDLNTSARPRQLPMERLGYAIPKASPFVTGYEPGRMSMQTMMPQAQQPPPIGMPTPTPAPVPMAPPPPAGVPPMPPLARVGGTLPAAPATAAPPPGRAPEWVPVWEGIDQLPPDAGHELQSYINMLYAGGRYKGSDDLFRQLASLKADEIRKKYAAGGAGGIDFSGLSKIGDQFGGLKDQLMSVLSARGIGGSGIEGGALSRLSGMEGISEGDYIRGLTEQRRQEQLQKDMADRQMLMNIIMRGQDQRAKEQSDPGILGDILGIAGGIVPYLLPGRGNQDVAAGAAAGAAGGGFGLLG